MIILIVPKDNGSLIEFNFMIARLAVIEPKSQFAFAINPSYEKQIPVHKNCFAIKSNAIDTSNNLAYDGSTFDDIQRHYAFDVMLTNCASIAYNLKFSGESPYDKTARNSLLTCNFNEPINEYEKITTMCGFLLSDHNLFFSNLVYSRYKAITSMLLNETKLDDIFSLRSSVIEPDPFKLLSAIKTEIDRYPTEFIRPGLREGYDKIFAKTSMIELKALYNHMTKFRHEGKIVVHGYQAFPMHKILKIMRKLGYDSRIINGKQYIIRGHK